MRVDGLYRVGRMFALICAGLAALTLAGACAPGTDGTGGGDNGGGDGGGTGGGTGVLVGQVWSVDGQPIPGVAIRLSGGRSASTDDSGVYSFIGLGVGTKIIANFEQPGFTSTTKALTVQDSDDATPVCVFMATAADTVTIDAGAGSTQRSGDSAVTIPPGSLVDADGIPSRAMWN